MAGIKGYTGLIGRFTLPQGVTVPGHCVKPAGGVSVAYENEIHRITRDFEVSVHDSLPNTSKP